jgi:hypothetical protein
MPDDYEHKEEKGEKEEEESTASSTASGSDCSETMSLKKYEGATGKKFRVNCPKGCGNKGGVVIGTMIY